MSITHTHVLTCQIQAVSVIVLLAVVLVVVMLTPGEASEESEACADAFRSCASNGDCFKTLQHAMSLCPNFESLDEQAFLTECAETLDILKTNQVLVDSFKACPFEHEPKQD